VTQKLSFYVEDDDASAREGLARLMRSAGLIRRCLRQERNSFLRRD
jgi:hypothetical protein